VYSLGSRLKLDAVCGMNKINIKTLYFKLRVLQFVAPFLYSASITLNGMINVYLVYLASNNSIVHVQTGAGES
jgi:hypothetical protein